jgi:hypothetical protein
VHHWDIGHELTEWRYLRPGAILSISERGDDFEVVALTDDEPETAIFGDVIRPADSAGHVVLEIVTPYTAELQILVSSTGCSESAIILLMLWNFSDWFNECSGANLSRHRTRV